MIYDRNKYDISPFDREGVLVATLKIYIDSNTSIYAAINITRNLSADLDTETDIIATALNQIHMEAALDTGTSIYGKTYGLVHFSAYLDTETDIVANLLRTTFAAATIDTGTDIYANILRIVGLMADLDTETDLYANLEKYIEYLYTYSGNLVVGETVTISGVDFTVLKDGSNAMSDYDSAIFPKVETGQNAVIYSDEESGRTVLISVTKSDRRL